MLCFSGLSEEHTASLFRVTELVQVFAEVMGVKKTVDYRRMFEGIQPITGTEEERADWTSLKPMGVQKSKRPFYGVNVWDMGRGVAIMLAS